MKRIIWIIPFIFALPLSGQTNPCNDSTFLSLKKVPIKDMTEREYDYFMMMSEECLEIIKQDTSKYAIEIKRGGNLEEAQARFTDARTKFIYFYIGLIVFFIGAILVTEAL